MSKALFDLILPSYSDATTPLWNQGKSSTSSFLWSLVPLEGMTYANQGNSEQSVWGLSEGQDTSTVANVEAQREKLLLSLHVLRTEVGVASWLP